MKSDMRGCRRICLNNCIKKLPQHYECGVDLMVHVEEIMISSLLSNVLALPRTYKLHTLLYRKSYNLNQRKTMNPYDAMISQVTSVKVPNNSRFTKQISWNQCL